MLRQKFELTIRQLCEDVLSEPKPTELPRKIIEHVQGTFPVAWSTLWLTEQKGSAGGKRLKLAAAAGSAEKLMHAEDGGPAVYDFGEGLTGEIAQRQAPVNISRPDDFAKYHHVHKYDRVMYNREKAGDLCRCVLGVPLMLKSTSGAGSPDADPWRVIGVLKLENIQQTPEHPESCFTQRDVEIAEGYAAVIAVALEKAQMRADSIRIGAGLLDVSRGLLAELGETPKLEEIVKQTANVISAEACALWLRSGLELRLKAAYGYHGGRGGVPHYPLEVPTDTGNQVPDLAKDPSKWEEWAKKIFKGVGLTVYVANTSRQLNLKTADEVCNHFAWKGANDVRMWNKPQGKACYSLVAIPLIDNETQDLKGVFKIENKKPTMFQLQSYFTEEDQQLLTTLGNSISLALIIAERIDRLRRLEKLVGDIRVLGDLDEALFFILTGLTHGGGLQYNRAMVFLKDDAQPERLVCRYAVGQIEPSDWQREMDKKEAQKSFDLDQLLREFRDDREPFTKSPMMKHWAGHEVVLNDAAQSIAVHATKRGQPAAGKQDTAKYMSGNLSQQDFLYGFVNGDYVLIPMYFEKKLLGVIYADNQFTGNRVNKFECEVLDLFAGMAGAIIQASKVPDKLKKERDDAWRNFSRPAAHRLGTEAGIIDNEAVLYISRELKQAVKVPGGRLAVRGTVIRNSLQVIRQAVSRLRLAVKDYQRLSFEAEDPREFDLCDLINSTVHTTTRSLRKISVHVEGCSQPIQVLSRRAALAYVFEELLINAWKEVGADGNEKGSRHTTKIRLRIQVQRNGDSLRCIHSDNGRGIPEDLRSTLFFKPLKGRRGGTGLGMYIVGQILRENHGSIKLISDGLSPGHKGACFQINLPVRPPLT